MNSPDAWRLQPSLHLDSNDRSILVRDLLTRLQEAAPDSHVSLRGSLAEQRADVYSDIDVLWIVPDQGFLWYVTALTSILASVRSVESVRYDPEFQNSTKRRLVFVRFDDTPLFWRLDLDVRAQSINDVDDCGNSMAIGTDWSTSESALANAVAAVKAHLRHNDRTARDLLDRAYQRVGLDTPNVGLRSLTLTLVRAVRLKDPKTTQFSERIEQLVMAAFDPD